MLSISFMTAIVIIIMITMILKILAMIAEITVMFMTLVPEILLSAYIIRICKDVFAHECLYHVCACACICTIVCLSVCTCAGLQIPTRPIARDK